jgi:protoporphyrinogen/coproporphyrinogen III oxidase
MSARFHVVGGGIAGLAAAWELSASEGVQVTVHEASDRWGGKVHTSPFAGHPVDEGADAFLLRVPWAVDLARELGLEAEIVHPAERRAYIWSRGDLRPMPAEHVLGVPLDLDDLAATGLLDDAELAATRGAMGRPAGPVTEDDLSVADLVTRAVGRPALDRVVAPLLGGINAGQVDAMSAAALAPQLLAAARQPEGLVAALRAQRAAADTSAPIFGGFAGGTQRLVDRLVEALAERGVELRLKDKVHSLGHVEEDGTVLALPAFATADLLADPSPGAAGLLNTIGYASPVLVTLAVPAAGIDHALDASGFLVPHTEGLLLTACSWASRKWSHLAAGDTVILRASAGSAHDDRAQHLSDRKLVKALRADLRTTMGLTGDPTEVRVSRWPQSLPQYAVGHLAMVADLRHTLAVEHPGLALAGSAYEGVGLPACIHDGRMAARRLLDTRG